MSSPKLDGFDDRQSRALLAELAKLRAELSPRADRVLDRRKTGTIRPRPGDVVRANANDVVVLPHPRSAKGKAPVVVLVEAQPVTVTAESGTVNDATRVAVTTLGAMEWFSTGTEWWGTAVGGSGGSGGATLTYGSPVDVGTANADGVSTAVARADHVHKDRIATGSANGFLSRRVYANAASARVGTTFMGVTVQAAANWTTDADIPDGNWFRMCLVAAGGSGACGMQGHTTGGHGGAGGGGGARQMWTVSRAQLVTLLPITMTLGLGGATVASTTTNTGTVATSPGLVGGNAVFGPWSVFGGGGANAGGASAATAGGGGGGWRSAGGGGATSTANVAGGNPLGGLGSNLSGAETTANAQSSTYGGGGCAAPSGTSAGVGGFSVHGGGAGGAPAATAVDAGVGRGGHSLFGGAGGGSGGFCNGGANDNDGAAGGNSGGGTAAAGTAGAGQVGNGSAGGNGADSPDVFVCSGAGGGGGGSGGSTATAVAVLGGNGGAGGFPGGGGGGGGSVVAANLTNTTAGSGGAGGDACFVVEAMV